MRASFVTERYLRLFQSQPKEQQQRLFQQWQQCRLCRWRSTDRRELCLTTTRRKWQQYLWRLQHVLQSVKSNASNAANSTVRSGVATVDSVGQRLRTLDNVRAYLSLGISFSPRLLGHCDARRRGVSVARWLSLLQPPPMAVLSSLRLGRQIDTHPACAPWRIALFFGPSFDFVCMCFFLRLVDAAVFFASLSLSFSLSLSLCALVVASVCVLLNCSCGWLLAFECWLVPFSLFI